VALGTALAEALAALAACRRDELVLSDDDEV
jgi:hypothetical protein